MSFKDLLREFVKEAVGTEELGPDSENVDDAEQDKEIDEMSTCASIAGYSLPLGMDPESATARQEKKKK